MATVGIHLVWTTYGTWLPGDQRGHWSPLFDLYGHILERGGKINRSDLESRLLTLDLMKESPKVLDSDEQKLVAQTIGSLVDNANQPQAYAAAIEPTHVHLLLGPVAEKIHLTAGRLKGTTSSALLGLPQNRDRNRTWTAKDWKVFLFDDIALAAVKRYIEEHNVRKGLPPAPYDWLI